jgi:hypothetical protein
VKEARLSVNLAALASLSMAIAGKAYRGNQRHRMRASFETLLGLTVPFLHVSYRDFVSQLA